MDDNDDATKNTATASLMKRKEKTDFSHFDQQQLSISAYFDRTKVT